jgi:hypothetical protein
VADLHEKILSPAQRRLLKRLSAASEARRFYLAGGTAVALRFGHRRSLDFDWFTDEPLPDPLSLAQDLRDERLKFRTHRTDRGALHGAIGGIRVGFLEYRYPLLRPVEWWPEYGCSLASADDLSCMKLAAIVQRGLRKDFLDIYALGKEHRPLSEMIELYRRKYGMADIGHVLQGLAYFDDADKDRMPAMLWKVDWRTVKATIRAWLKELVRR